VRGCGFGGDGQPEAGATAFRWSAGPEVRELLPEAYAVRVLDALDSDRSPAIRKHDGEHVL
jgi:8-oxo-dGTP diphosphatase